ncbi:acyl-CoA/acyl-ACP dehydrogenase [Chromobacterium haemolyticum]|uniref:Acyl-CoA/acyl-ACP dehydrogenase n=1 Tax=Chromobacterium haemolyticum TaxID=394935 RepID=A0ABS3GI71_9NEIS|nr:acyl-CoA dehydrogenase family protein [Chromobacterium haemolyticum]MBK0413187.1 acyl-CoA/acyl-ACP dehydrogenase [Chromobacterium haemolyticum]MBO0414289.1 acyl-CoA/acyl-ACP dehydrogenase [Chromobacterium haemolyticum]MBO0497852.1 acyl-CoA/acyl-ACP dehydrogenase [Chromobacterium haemolyticum]
MPLILQLSLPSAMHQAESLALLRRIDQRVRQQLAPQAAAIDQQALYPQAMLRGLGEDGAYAALLPAEQGGSSLGLATLMASISEVGAACGSTAFLAWCQSACVYLLRHAAPREELSATLSELAAARRLGGPGLSNAIKHLAGLEAMRLRAELCPQGYRISGELPWVSNLGAGHLFVAAASCSDGGKLVFLADCDTPGVRLNAGPPIAGMNGTRTLCVKLDQVLIPSERVLAEPAAFVGFIRRVRPGFVLAQAAVGLGIVQGCLDDIQAANLRDGEQNRWLDHSYEELAAELAALWREAKTLAPLAEAGQAAPPRVLRLRAEVSELCLRAAMSAQLHAGAAGYLLSSPAQRRLREASFIAIVTPTLKQLRREIHHAEQPQPA